jgi:hypothetical protein
MLSKQFNPATSTWRNLSLGCRHAMTTKTEFNSSALTAEDRAYLQALWDAVGGLHQAFYDTVGGLLWTLDNRWSNKDIFWNCHNNPPDWARFKSDLAYRHMTIPKLLEPELKKRGIAVMSASQPVATPPKTEVDAIFTGTPPATTPATTTPATTGAQLSDKAAVGAGILSNHLGAVIGIVALAVAGYFFIKK